MFSLYLLLFFLSCPWESVNGGRLKAFSTEDILCCFVCAAGSKVITLPKEGRPRDGGMLMDVNMAEWFSHVLGCANQGDRQGCPVLWLWPVSYRQLSLPLKLHRETQGKRNVGEAWNCPPRFIISDERLLATNKDQKQRDKSAGPELLLFFFSLLAYWISR